MDLNENVDIATNANKTAYLEEKYNFKHPIEYSNDVKIMDQEIINTLELVKSIDDNETPIYNTIFQANDAISTMSLNKSAHYYTTDIGYLRDTQKLIKHISSANCDVNSNNSVQALDAYEEIKRETGFYEKYLYLNFDSVKFLNENASFLQFMSVYNVMSPLISLCIPILVLILPFIIIKIKGVEVNLNEYMTIINQLISNHAITKIFTDFNSVDIGEKLYILLSAFFYCFSIYQNINTCVKFYQNMMRMHEYVKKFHAYVKTTISRMTYYLSITKHLKKYKLFCLDLENNLNVLINFYDKMNNISSFELFLSSSKIIKLATTEMGELMEIFYKLFDNKMIDDALLYSFGFNGYWYNLLQIKQHVNSKKMSFAKYISKKELKELDKTQKNPVNKIAIENMYYPKFIGEQTCVKNSCELDKHLILTGPNASGKTTFIKSVFINVLLSQQFGIGCYSKLQFTPYEYFHCYLNIPDTSGRDSLFQAEARRCKNIINTIDECDDKDRHFCIFDELYSGTNPDEAIVSAEAFMNYMTSLNNTLCLLTTHYVKLCKKMNKNENIINCCMNTKIDELSGNYIYTYKLKTGISKIKGGLQVLKDMNYPTSIINDIFQLG